MSDLLQSLAAPGSDDPTRRQVLNDVLEAGLPGARSEAWKYTPLRALERRSFGVAETLPEIDAALLAAIPAPRLVFINGVHAEQWSDLSGLPEGVQLTAGRRPPQTAEDRRFSGVDAVFARLGVALAHDGVQLRAEAGTQGDTPVHLVFIGAADSQGADLAWHLHHRIELDTGASLVLAEHHIASGRHRHLDNGVLELALAEGAALQHARIQSGDDGATAFLRTEATLADSARYDRVDLELGGALSRHELNVRLLGKDTRLTANGVLLATGRRHLDTRLGIEHVSGDSECGLLWRGIGDDRGRVVFHGGITIHEGADGSNAQLSNKNLLLSASAEIDTQPVLVIHADEVQAAHGATVGQLDPQALFYLRSRGLPEAEAQRLLTGSFVREPLAAIGAESVRRLLDAYLDRALQTLADA